MDIKEMGKVGVFCGILAAGVGLYNFEALNHVEEFYNLALWVDSWSHLGHLSPVLASGFIGFVLGVSGDWLVQGMRK